MKTRLMSGLSAILFTMLLISCSKDSNNSGGSGGGGTTPNLVSMRGSAFSPANLQVTPGTMVTFRNDDVMTHTVTANDGSFDSGSIPAGSQFQRTFNDLGVYDYHCQIHSGMTGKITVVTR